MRHYTGTICATIHTSCKTEPSYDLVDEGRAHKWNDRSSLCGIGWEVGRVTLSQIRIRMWDPEPQEKPHLETGNAEGARRAASNGPTIVGKEVAEIIRMDAETRQANCVTTAFVFWQLFPSEAANFVCEGIAQAEYKENETNDITVRKRNVAVLWATGKNPNSCRNTEHIGHAEHERIARCQDGRRVLPPNRDQVFGKPEDANEHHHRKVSPVVNVGRHDDGENACAQSFPTLSIAAI